MAEKNFILNADDFGLSKDYNMAIPFAYGWGFLKSASLCANGEAFENAINEILPECPELSIGVHLNIISGNAITKCDLLTNSKGEFNNSFFSLIRKSKNKMLLKQVENEFRAQIEKVAKHTKIYHLNSHGHAHAIPEIFKLTVKLAKEYGIPFIRTHNEEFYLVPNLLKNFNLKLPINILKMIVLKHFTAINTQNLDGIKTNNYIIGITYSKLMDKSTIQQGLSTIENEDCTIEVVIHPKYISSNKKVNKEFEITQDKILEHEIYGLGYKLTNYKNI